MSLWKHALSILLLVSATLSVKAEEPRPAPIGMDELVRMVLDRDAKIEDLRMDLGISEGRAREIRYWEDPELRIEYSHKGDERIPLPYRETVTQTRTERGHETQTTRIGRQTTGDELRTGGLGGDDIRSNEESLRGSSTRNESFSTRQTDTITREYFPHRDGIRIRETQKSNISGNQVRTTSESQQKTGTENRNDEPFPIQITENQSSRQTEKTDIRGQNIRVDEIDRTYARSPYEGSDRYTMQLRIRPPNPWVIANLIKQARAEVTLAEFELQSEQAMLAAEIRRDFRRAALAEREASLAALRVEVRQHDLEFFESLRAAGVPIVRRLAERQSALSREKIRQVELSARAQALREDLALRAGVEDESQIDFPKEAEPLIRFDEMSKGQILAVMEEAHPQLAHATKRLKVEEFGYYAVRAERIPWFALLAVEAGYEEQYGERVRDDWGVFAGFSLPVFSWVSGDLGAETKQGAKILQQRIQRLKEDISRSVPHAGGSAG